jgi:uroporphyrin-III C-methyltransferase
MEPKNTNRVVTHLVTHRALIPIYCLMGLIVMLGLSAFAWFQMRDQAFAKTLATQQLFVDQLQKTVSVDQTRIQQLQATTQSGYLLERIKYLVWIAKADLDYLHDLDGALAALGDAEQLLKQAPPGWEKIRIALAQDKLQLQSIPKLDRSNILIQLEALKNQANTLPTILTIHSEQPAHNEVENTTRWTNLKNSIDTLWRLIIIRHTDKPVQPLLPQQQSLYLQQNLALLLQQAQWAVLYGDQTLYLHNLQEVQRNLKEHFALTSGIEHAIAVLKELETINIQPRIPQLATIRLLSDSKIPDGAQ